MLPLLHNRPYPNYHNFLQFLCSDLQPSAKTLWHRHPEKQLRTSGKFPTGRKIGQGVEGVGEKFDAVSGYGGPWREGSGRPRAPRTRGRTPDR